MTFHPSHFAGLVAEDSQAQARLFTQYLGRRDDFDRHRRRVGHGGRDLADELTELAGNAKRILVLDAGSYLFPTHVAQRLALRQWRVARSFSCRNFWQAGGFGDEHYLHEAPQLNLGGRSIFWSGLISLPSRGARFLPGRSARRADPSGAGCRWQQAQPIDHARDVCRADRG